MNKLARAPGIDRFRVIARQYAAGVALAVAVINMAPETRSAVAGVGIVRERQWTGRFAPSEVVDDRWVLTVPIADTLVENCVEVSAGPSLN